MNKKLTKRDVDGFSYEGGWDVRWDASITGFGVRIYPSGKKSYILSYRNEKRQKRLLTIGQTNKVTLDKARDAALKHLGQLVDKVDPVEERKRKSTGRTLQNVFYEYLDRYAKANNKTWPETQRIFERDIIPPLGKKLVQDVSRQDVIKLVDDAIDRGSKTMANRILAHVRKFFNWCIERGLIEVSPADKISKPTPETSRDRILSDEEIRNVWNACTEDGYPYGYLVQFLLLTAQRKNEAATMQWNHIDFRKKIWTLPKENTKSNRRHEVPLSQAAIDILKRAKQIVPENAVYVFTTTGNVPFSGFSKAKRRMDKKLKSTQNNYQDWRLHDLRRTAASGMASLGIAPHVIERILNHSSGTISGIAAVYNRYNYQEEMKKALNAWESSLNTST